MPHVIKKPLAASGNLAQTKKLGIDRTLDGLEKPFRNNPSQKN